MRSQPAVSVLSTTQPKAHACTRGHLLGVKSVRLDIPVHPNEFHSSDTSAQTANLRVSNPTVVGTSCQACKPALVRRGSCCYSKHVSAAQVCAARPRAWSATRCTWTACPGSATTPASAPASTPSTSICSRCVPDQATACPSRPDVHAGIDVAGDSDSTPRRKRAKGLSPGSECYPSRALPVHTGMPCLSCWRHACMCCLSQAQILHGGPFRGQRAGGVMMCVHAPRLRRRTSCWATKSTWTCLRSSTARPCATCARAAPAGPRTGAGWAKCTCTAAQSRAPGSPPWRRSGRGCRRSSVRRAGASFVHIMVPELPTGLQRGSIAPRFPSCCNPGQQTGLCVLRTVSIPETGMHACTLSRALPQQLSGAEELGAS